WRTLPEYVPTVELDLWVVMPNHLHGLLVLTDSSNQPACSAQPPFQRTVGHLVNRFKGAVTRQARQHLAASDARIWQSRYHDHIVRNEPELNRIRAYVETNPSRWDSDTFYVGSDMMYDS